MLAPRRTGPGASSRTLLEVVRDRPPVARAGRVDDLLDEVLELAASIRVDVAVERVTAEGLPPVDVRPVAAPAAAGRARRRGAARARRAAARRDRCGSARRATGAGTRCRWRLPSAGRTARRCRADGAGARRPANGRSTASARTLACGAGRRRGPARPDAADRRDGCRPRQRGATAQPADAHRARTAATVLVCDDEDSIRALLARILERDGLRVVDAADGPGRARDHRGDRVDAVLTDQHMAGMSGIELYAAAVAAQPGARRPVRRDERRAGRGGPRPVRGRDAA